MRWLIALAVVALAAAVVPARAAAPVTIEASNYQFSPANVTIDRGDTVTLHNAGGMHNFVFADESIPPSPGSGWSDQQKAFAVAGTYSFHCGQHPEMRGTIQVSPPTPTPTPSVTPTPTPSPTPPPGATPTAPPLVRDVHLVHKTFGIRCRHPGVALQLTLTRAARVRGTLTRKGRRFGRVEFGTLNAGNRTLRFTKTTARKPLARGRYKLALRIGTERARTLRFRVS